MGSPKTRNAKRKRDALSTSDHYVVQDKGPWEQLYSKYIATVLCLAMKRGQSKPGDNRRLKLDRFAFFCSFGNEPRVDQRKTQDWDTAGLRPAFIRDEAI